MREAHRILNSRLLPRDARLRSFAKNCKRNLAAKKTCGECLLTFAADFAKCAICCVAEFHDLAHEWSLSRIDFDRRFISGH